MIEIPTVAAAIVAGAALVAVPMYGGTALAWLVTNHRWYAYAWKHRRCRALLCLAL